MQSGRTYPVGPGRMVGALLALAMLVPAGAPARAQMPSMTPVAPGVWRMRLGDPEPLTAVTVSPFEPRAAALAELPPANKCAIDPADVGFRRSPRGCVVELPLAGDEHAYGLGVRLTTFDVTGTRQNVVVSDNPDQGDGSGHGPAPFYVTTAGYGVFVDTLRYARFYFGNLAKVGGRTGEIAKTSDVITDIDVLYEPRHLPGQRVTIDVPVAQGVDVYIFGGPALRQAVQRYNLFAGGGALPPLWGLGVFYRGFGRFDADAALDLARSFRDKDIPVTVFGLEPGWHTHAYSCSYRWSDRFPNPAEFISRMRQMGYQLNLWEQAFVHPTAPFYDEIKRYSGDYEVWQGLVPDFTLEGAQRIFTDYHRRMFLDQGITGFKLDECDNQPYKSEPWSFPEFARFPSGLDGEQMHSLFGVAFQRTMTGMFRAADTRTWSQVRASHALAAPLPFVLYSDAYNHRNYVRGMLNGGFSGLLWQPEIRTADSTWEFYRRVQTAVFSPQTLVNAWFIPNPPWLQYDENRNHRGEFLPDHEQIEKVTRGLFRLRMQLVPYLYAAFMQYHRTGLPPLRALVMDYPDDPAVYDIDDEYLVGSGLLFAPLFANETQRDVYLPAGDWYDFWSGQRYAGGQTHAIEVPAERPPLFVKDGTLLPLAEPVAYLDRDTTFAVTVRSYGWPCADFTLYEDDGVSYGYERGAVNEVVLRAERPGGGSVHRSGRYDGQRYEIVGWEAIGAEGVALDETAQIEALAAEPLGAHAVRLESLDLGRMSQAAGEPRVGRTFDNNPLTLGGRVFAHGVGSHAFSEMIIDLKGAAETFRSVVGVDDECPGRGSAVFQVWVDGEKRADSGVLRGGQGARYLEADLRGGHHLMLLITDAGDGIGSDHANWAEARIELRPDAADKPEAIGVAEKPVYDIAPTDPDRVAINGPLIVGATPGRPFLHRIAATGLEPRRFSAAGLPAGLKLDPGDGLITGRLARKGVAIVELTLSTSAGKVSRDLVIVGGRHRLALTPPMGWNSWNVWACDVDVHRVRAAIQWMDKSGLADHGYQYVNIDDCWQAGRGPDGSMLPNDKFPDMAELATYAHSKGLKLGIYSSPGPKTCAGYEGSYDHELQDARTWAQWGIDYVKYDWCSYFEVARGDGLATHKRPYIVMREALDQVDRDIVYSLCQYGMADVWKWGQAVGGDLWRTTGDITDTWASMSYIGFRQDEIARYSGPGGWNDPDMLVVGRLGWGGKPRPTRLNRNEQVTHMTLWALLAAPLLIGCDLSQLDAFTIDLLTNDEVLAVNQDPLGRAATCRVRDGFQEVWARRLYDGTMAVGLFNRWPQPREVVLRWADVEGLRGAQPVRDLWQKRDLGTMQGEYRVTIEGHGCRLLKLGAPRGDTRAWLKRVQERLQD